MSITKEITKIIEYQNSTLLLKDRKNETAINSLIQQVIDDYENGNYDFTRLKKLIKSKSGKLGTQNRMKPSHVKKHCVFI